MYLVGVGLNRGEASLWTSGMRPGGQVQSPEADVWGRCGL